MEMLRRFYHEFRMKTSRRYRVDSALRAVMNGGVI